MKIKTKVIIAASLLVTSVAALSYFSIKKLNLASGHFSLYRDTARHTNIVGRVQANLLLTRIYAKDFILQQTEESIVNVYKRAEQTFTLIKKMDSFWEGAGHDSVENSEHLIKDISKYIALFDQVVELQRSRNDLFKRQLEPIGKTLQKNLIEQFEDDHQDSDTFSLYHIGNVLNAFLSGKAEVNNFLVKNDELSYSQASAELQNAHNRLITLIKNEPDQHHKDQQKIIKKNLLDYQTAFEQIYEVINSRNKLIKAMDATGPAIADALEIKKLTNKQKQDQLGPVFERSILHASSTNLIMAIIAFAIALVSVLYIIISVFSPLRLMTKTMAELSNGNTDVQIPKYQPNEMGDISHAVQAFKNKIIEVHRLNEEQLAIQENLEETVDIRTRELNQALEEAQVANKEKSRFLSNMTHELRTPLHIIVSYCRLAMKNTDPEKRNKFLENILDGSVRMEGLVNSLLDLSNLELGKINPIFENGEFNFIVRQTIDALTTVSSEKNIKIEFDDKEVIHLQFDPKLMLQVMMHIVTNAITYSPENSVITIKSQDDRNHGATLFRCEIIDQGIGVPKDELQKVFYQFSESSKTKSQAGGRGMGLAISQKIILLHNGRIWLESPPKNQENGTAVIFELPLSQDNDINLDIQGMPETIASDRKEKLLKLAEDYMERFNPEVYASKIKSELVEDLNIYSAELQAQNAELLEHEQQYSLLAEKFVSVFTESAVGFVIIDNNGKIIDINARATQYMPGSSLALRPGVAFYPYLSTSTSVSEEHLIPQYMNWLADADEEAPFEMHYVKPENRWLRFNKAQLNKDNTLITITDITSSHS